MAAVDTIAAFGRSAGCVPFAINVSHRVSCYGRIMGVTVSAEIIQQAAFCTGCGDYFLCIAGFVVYRVDIVVYIAVAAFGAGVGGIALICTGRRRDRFRIRVGASAGVAVGEGFRGEKIFSFFSHKCFICRQMIVCDFCIDVDAIIACSKILEGQTIIHLAFV